MVSSSGGFLQIFQQGNCANYNKKWSYSSLTRTLGLCLETWCSVTMSHPQAAISESISKILQTDDLEVTSFLITGLSIANLDFGCSLVEGQDSWPKSDN